MAASKLLAPYFGASLQQWAIVIALVLVSYSLGYGLYKRIARVGMQWAMLFASIYCFASPFFFEAIVNTLVTLPFHISLVICTFLSVFPSSLLWASALPYAQSQVDEGKSKLLVWNTLGNLIGIFLFSFFLIPFVGVYKSFFILGGISLLLSFLIGKVKERVVVAVVFLLTGPLFFLNENAHELELSTLGQVTRGYDLIESRRTYYQSYSLWKKQNQENWLFSMNGGLQFVWDKNNYDFDDPHYLNFGASIYSWLGRENGEALFIGLGGGLAPWVVHQKYPQVKKIALEIDPHIASVAKRYLPPKELSEFNIIVTDARRYLMQTNKIFDYVFMDSYLGTMIPEHLVTSEFFYLLSKRIGREGVLVLNLSGHLSKGSFIANLTKSVAQSFKHLAIYRVPQYSYLLLIASHNQEILRRGTNPHFLAKSNGPKISTLALQSKTPLFVHGKAYTDDLNSVSFDLARAQVENFKLKATARSK